MPTMNHINRHSKSGHTQNKGRHIFTKSKCTVTDVYASNRTQVLLSMCEYQWPNLTTSYISLWHKLQQYRTRMTAENNTHRALGQGNKNRSQHNHNHHNKSHHSTHSIGSVQWRTDPQKTSTQRPDHMPKQGSCTDVK